MSRLRLRKAALGLFAGLLVPAFFAAAQTVRFGVIGDYGAGTPAESEVAALVKSWNPDFILTVGDNNYDSGAASTIDANIGRYYHDFIYNYVGQYGPGSPTWRFLPALGNHDWGDSYPNPGGAAPYLAYFDLPGNERYYDFRLGPVHVFAVDSDPNEPDGNGAGSRQANWLRNSLASSDAPWKIVYFHHPPYSSGLHGSSFGMRWPFGEWGASAVLSGHDHTYERLDVDGIPYLVDGLGGKSIYEFTTVLPESRVRYNGDYGALRMTATETTLTFEFFNRSGIRVDAWMLTRPRTVPTPLRRPAVVPWRTGAPP